MVIPVCNKTPIVSVNSDTTSSADFGLFSSTTELESLLSFSEPAV